jgi:hypothetical protein
VFVQKVDYHAIRVGDVISSLVSQRELDLLEDMFVFASSNGQCIIHFILEKQCGWLSRYACVRYDCSMGGDVSPSISRGYDLPGACTSSRT